MTALRARPVFRLTQHFFGGLFDLGFLSEGGARTFRRFVIGVAAVILSVGLLVTRIFLAKYTGLSTHASADVYLQAVLADQAFMIALPMWTAGFATVLVGHALFPDETDFRILMALPITRRAVFGSKLLAVALFTGLLSIAAHAALMPMVALIGINTWAEQRLVHLAAAHMVVGLAASAFAALAIVALHGLVLILVPRTRVVGVSTAFRSAMLCAFVLALPFAGLLPLQGRSFEAGARWLALVPPAWFFGLERLLLGDFRFMELARTAAVGFGLSGVVAATSYALLYRRFDRVMLRRAGGRPLWSVARRLRRIATRPKSPFKVVRAFTLVTFRRSPLHQGMLALLSSIGLGIVTIRVLFADFIESPGMVGSPAAAAAVSAPFALMFVCALATRATLLVPIESRANWIFRMTEAPVERPRQLAAAGWTIGQFGVAAPVVLLVPLQLLLLGSATPRAVVVELILGWLLVETLLMDWTRLPFTCSYLPGKGFVPQMVLKGIVAFTAFVLGGSALVGLGMHVPTVALILLSAVMAVSAAMRWHRRRTWRHRPLQFEDELPSEINPLQLSGDLRDLEVRPKLGTASLSADLRERVARTPLANRRTTSIESRLDLLSDRAAEHYARVASSVAQSAFASSLRARSSYRLTRHFFNGLFDLGFLSDAGVASFKRLVLGVCATFLSGGFLLARIFAATYHGLAADDAPERYSSAVLGDHMFLIAVPMWIVGFATVLLGHALFPDETDFRILMGLPVAKRNVFSSKVLAVGLFTGLFAIAAHVALAPTFLLTAFNPWAEYGVFRLVAAHLAASFVACTFSAAAVAAMHGLVLTLVPRAYVLGASTALRSLMIGVFVVAVPFVAVIPVYGELVLTGAAWIDAVPPAWFLGLERLLLGELRFLPLASNAGAALAAVCLVTAASYAWLYRRVDRVMLRRNVAGPRRFKRLAWRRVNRARSPLSLIRWFAAVTMWRSTMHQGVVVFLCSLGLGLVAISFLLSDFLEWLQGGEVPLAPLRYLVLWAPFALMFFSAIAARSVLLVPIEPRANWQFRMTEQPQARVAQLGAVPRIVGQLGVVFPIVLFAPAQWPFVGYDLAEILGVELVFGWLLVETLLWDWSRLPFTCSYIPGKGFVPQMILKGFLTFIVFTTLGPTVAQLITVVPPSAALVLSLVAIAAAFLGWHRRRTWAATPLQFEDELPTEISPLKLSQ